MLKELLENMKSRLKNILTGFLIGSTLLSPLKSGELEEKIFLKRNQKEKVAIFNREINQDIMNYSFVEDHQKKIYETNNNYVSPSEKEKINQLFEGNSSEDLESKTNTFIEVSRVDKDKYLFTYKNSGRKDLSELEKKRLPNCEEFFREDTKNTHIYFIYPPRSELEIISQKIDVLNNRTERVRKLNTEKYEDTNFYETISTVSDFLDLYKLIIPKIEDPEIENSKINNLGYNQENENSLGLNNLLDNLLFEDNPQVKLAKKIPGKTGTILKGTIFLSKILMNEVERQNRLNFWEQDLSEDWKVQKMPFYLGEDTNLFQDNIISRETLFEMEGNYNKFYIAISSLPYITGIFNTQTTGIEDILIEIEK